MGLLAKLSGHTAPVTLMVLHENQNGRITDKNQLVSLSTDKVFKVWDLRTYQNLQTIVDTSLYRPENRISCLFFDCNNRRYNRPCLVSGTNRLTLWPIIKSNTENYGITHSAPIVAALYNETFDQVISGGLDGSINVWDYSTGNIVFKFNKAHDNAKMTCMCLDFNQRRLVTGADDGSCKLWNFSNGQCLQRYGGSFAPKELSSVVFAVEQPKRPIATMETSDKFLINPPANSDSENFATFTTNSATDDCMKYILTGGWERQVFVYEDTNSNTALQRFSHCMPPLSYSDKRTMMAKKTHNKKSNGRNRPKSAHIYRRSGK